MASLSLEEVASAVGGARVQGDGAMAFGKYAIDSRGITGGELFFALRGPNHDGHDFLAEAFARGAAAAVVSRPDAAAPQGRGLVRVADTTRALQDLAASLRRRLAPRVVGITGSSGKTTTKEMTAAALAAGCGKKVHRTRGNLNNTFGMPLTMLEMDDDAGILVLEMGMSYPGEMARLAEIADPDVGVLLNVSAVHREHFDSVEAIADAKAELLRGMRRDAVAVCNAADPLVAARCASFPGRRITFAVDAGADLAATQVRDDIVEGVRFSFRHAGAPERTVRLGLYGRHNAANAAAALAATLALGGDVAAAAAALETVGPSPGRGVVERLRQGVVLVDETYNSNPAAVETVLASLAATRWSGRRVFACGDMLELGEEAPHHHRQAGRRAARAGVDLLLAVGPLAGETAAGAREAGAAAVEIFPDSTAAGAAAARAVRPGDLVLVKGSRGIAMERVAEAVRAAYPPDGEAA